MIANILRFLGQRKSKLVRKNSKKLPKLFHHGFTEKIFKQKRSEYPFNQKLKISKIVKVKRGGEATSLTQKYHRLGPGDRPLGDFL